MRLVNDNVLERKLFECTALDEADFIRRDEHFKVLWDERGRDDLGAFVFGSGEQDDIEVGCPFAELACPVLEGGFGDDDEVGAADAPDVFEVGKEGDGLQGFTEALRGEGYEGMGEIGKRDAPFRLLECRSSRYGATTPSN